MVAKETPSPCSTSFELISTLETSSTHTMDKLLCKPLESFSFRRHDKLTFANAVKKRTTDFLLKGLELLADSQLAPTDYFTDALETL